MINQKNTELKRTSFEGTCLEKKYFRERRDVRMEKRRKDNEDPKQGPQIQCKYWWRTDRKPQEKVEGKNSDEMEEWQGLFCIQKKSLWEWLLKSQKTQKLDINRRYKHLFLWWENTDFQIFCFLWAITKTTLSSYFMKKSRKFNRQFNWHHKVTGKSSIL